MVVKIPGGFIEERRYLIYTVFKEFLGLEIEIINNSKPEYEILLPNKSSIIIEDHFFNNFNDGLDYLNRNNIPDKLFFCQNPFTMEKDIPVIYGQPEIFITDRTQKNIHCKIDLFSSVFFMLTRWEEYVITERDEFGRFPEKLSFSIRNGIHKRPLVNEYIEMLWKMLEFLGYPGKRKKMEFEAVITHDVDELTRYKNLFRLFRIISGDILLRKKPELISGSIKDYYEIKTGVKKDNYNTFDFLMDLSERINVRSHFYFLAQTKGQKSKVPKYNYDFRYDIFSPELKHIIENIQNREHLIGMHGSYNSYNNYDLFNEELNKLKSIAGEISESRQHYLRFLAPVTWSNANLCNIEQDSTMGFAEEIGFRCGTCSPFHVYDFLKREPLRLVELPLTIMDSAMLFITRSPDDFYSGICSMIDLVRKYNGKLVLLWHTNSFNNYTWYPYQNNYFRIIDYLSGF